MAEIEGGKMSKKFTLNEVADDQEKLLGKLSKTPSSPEVDCILDLLSIVVKLSHIVADLKEAK